MGLLMSDALFRVRRTIKADGTPSRYHPTLVALHWISAVLVGLAVATGKLWLEQIPNSPSDKVILLGVHMALGMAILALTIARFFVRIFTPRPKRVATGSALLDAMAVVTHYSLYVALLLMAVSGLATATMAGYPAIVLGDSAGPLPDTSQLLPRFVHGVMSWVIILLVALHVLGALYHHVIRNDGLLSRMWFSE
jgi:cytochrome b561